MIRRWNREGMVQGGFSAEVTTGTEKRMTRRLPCKDLEGMCGRAGRAAGTKPWKWNSQADAEVREVWGRPTGKGLVRREDIWAFMLSACRPVGRRPVGRRAIWVTFLKVHAVGWKMNSEGARVESVRPIKRQPQESRWEIDMNLPITRVPVVYFWKRCVRLHLTRLLVTTILVLKVKRLMLNGEKYYRRITVIIIGKYYRRIKFC